MASPGHARVPAVPRLVVALLAMLPVFGCTPGVRHGGLVAALEISAGRKCVWECPSLETAEASANVADEVGEQDDDGNGQEEQTVVARAGDAQLQPNPAADLESKPAGGSEAESTSGFETQPAIEAVTKPAADLKSKPASASEAKATRDLGTKPAIEAVTKPAAEIKSKPASDSEAKATRDLGTKPTTEAGTRPAADLEAKPAGGFEAKATGDLGKKPVIEDAIAKPAADLKAKPAGGSEAKSATDLGVRPVIDAVTKPAADSGDLERLGHLADERAQQEPSTAYRLGPGDLVEIKVFNLPDFNRTVRVATNGAIQLPLIGSVPAEGKSAEELSAEIVDRLARNLVRRPEVDVFVQDYRSQQVAVTGAVVKPGLYPLVRQSYTILDILSEAGGLTKEAGAVVDFIPASKGQRSRIFRVASTGMSLPQRMRGSPAGGAEQRPIRIDLNELYSRQDEIALNIPVIAGDVIFVPEAGSFTIEGWVDKPGSYPLNRDTTVLAALTTAGGPLFPARLTRVQVLRNQKFGATTRDTETVNLSDVWSGRAQDVPLYSGDVVRVPPWHPLLLPWGFYTVVGRLLSIGASIPIL